MALIIDVKRQVNSQKTMPGTRQFKRTRRLIKALVTFCTIASLFTSCNGKKTNYISNNQVQQELKTTKMKTILIIGMNPHTIDFTNPELPKGLTAQMVEQGTNATLKKLNAMGYEAEAFLIDTGTTDLNSLAKQLKDKNYSGVVIGNGIRSQVSNFILFEQIINVVHKDAPKSIIIFNTLPTNTDEAVKRWL
jgi:hypothetical protein